ncbi:MAG TPA: anti-sigma factor [Anaeromyxobacteraceae bacterium]|nr:anti-sigma factor [Anaeromyxobacteraceae bacterium]
MTPRHLTEDEAQLLVEGLVPQAEAPRVEAHLARCTECQALVASFEGLSDALGGLAAPEVPPDFTAGVFARIDARERAAARERRIAAAVLGAVGLAMAVAVALAGAAAWAPAVSDVSSALVRALEAIQISDKVLSPIVDALRVQIAFACALLGLPLLLGLARLVPARARLNA